MRAQGYTMRGLECMGTDARARRATDGARRAGSRANVTRGERPRPERDVARAGGVSGHVRRQRDRTSPPRAGDPTAERGGRPSSGLVPAKVPASRPAGARSRLAPSMAMRCKNRRDMHRARRWERRSDRRGEGNGHRPSLPARTVHWRIPGRASPRDSIELTPGPHFHLVPCRRVPAGGTQGLHRCGTPISSPSTLGRSVRLRKAT